MDDSRVSPAALAWAGLTAYIVAADVGLIKTNNLTMSTAFRSAVRHPVHRWPIILLWSYITAHLFLNLKWDPLSRAGSLVRRHEH